jgi:hypothetical protein
MGMIAQENSVSAWAFLIGIVLAVVIGLTTTVIPIPALVASSSAIYTLLVIIGLYVGFTFTKLGSKEAQTFMIAGTILVIVSYFGKAAMSGSLIGFQLADVINTVFGALVTLFVPATIVVALKTIFGLSRV